MPNDGIRVDIIHMKGNGLTMPHTFEIGSIRCHILSDGTHWEDGGGFFGLVPRLLWERVVTHNELNRIPVDSRALLIESDAGLILVDTGYGDKMDPELRRRYGLDTRNGRIIAEMSQIGFSPEEITTVVMTHFHNDHIGGGTHWENRDDPSSPVVPTYPNARYIAQRIELAQATFPNERTRATYLSHNWQPLMASDQLVVVDGPQRLATGVRTETAPGHTDSIQVVWVESGGKSLCFLTDACSWAAHMDRIAWVPAFDLDPMTSIETKRRLRQEAAERKTLLVFQHDGQVVAGRLVQGQRGPTVEPVISADPWSEDS
jgi:glyoxylase-like metal-dependent hydrolase (beta-lactamase superfamily II)